MSSLLLFPLSTPARRVEPREPMPFSVQRFSRSLGERNACIRSSTAQIVPMPDTAPMHPGDRIVLRACAFGGVSLLLLGLLGALP